MAQKIKLELTQEQAETLEFVLNNERENLLNHIRKISPVKDWLAFNSCKHELYAVETMLGNLKEPYLV